MEKERIVNTWNEDLHAQIAREKTRHAELHAKMTQENAIHGLSRDLNDVYASSARGIAGCDTEPPSLRERVWRDVRDAKWHARKADRLQELGLLLDKHPEVARILELIEETR